MDLSALPISVSSAMGNKTKKDEAAVQENIDAIIGELLTRFQSETGGVAAQLKIKTQEVREHLEAGNDLFTPQTAPAPAGALPAGTTSSSPNAEAERIGNEALAIVGGDATKIQGLLTMVAQIAAAGPEAAALATHLFGGLTGEQIKKAGPDLGDLIVTIATDVADGNDRILVRGFAAELESVDRARRTNSTLNTELTTILHDLGVTKAADAKTAIDDLKNLGKPTTPVLNTELADFIKLLAPALNMPATTSATIADQTKLVDTAKKAMDDSVKLEKQVKDSKAVATMNGVNTFPTDAGPHDIWVSIRANQEHRTTLGAMGGEKRPRINI